jgi:hypothetical protein
MERKHILRFVRRRRQRQSNGMRLAYLRRRTRAVQYLATDYIYYHCAA